MLSAPTTAGPGRVVKFRVRKQRRNKRRLIESVAQDWARWDAAAKATGVNFTEFARRALNLLSSQCEFQFSQPAKKAGRK